MDVIHVAMTLDYAYAVGAAVAIRSAIDSTPGPISIHIIDCGLSDSDRLRFQEIVKSREDVSIQLHGLQEGSLTERMGPLWAKIDMLSIVQVNRILYLDVDILVRRSLRPLWEVDLGGKAVGAVVDIGMPMGHDKANRQPFFNAGVLLFDLVKTRERLSQLLKICPHYQHTKSRDEDALNAHFDGGRWHQLGLFWNAQGLGTYASRPLSERDALPLDTMQDPSIVHFTGPLNPSVLDVLNPHVQPPTAKPWGYIGAPGHQYASEWWIVFDKTPWKEEKEAMIALHKKAKRKAVEKILVDFDAAVACLASLGAEGQI